VLTQIIILDLLLIVQVRPAGLLQVWGQYGKLGWYFRTSNSCKWAKRSI